MAHAPRPRAQGVSYEMQEMQERVVRQHVMEGEWEWWSWALPQYLQQLRWDRERLKEDHAADLEYEVFMREAAEERAREARRETSELDKEVDELRDALQKAKGREEQQRRHVAHANEQRALAL